MKVLLVQPYGDNGALKYHVIYKELENFIASSKTKVDLIVFPEAYEMIENDIEVAWKKVRDVAHRFDTPVLMGISTAFGTEEAYYFNPYGEDTNPDGDTMYKMYVKHSTSPAVFFDFEEDPVLQQAVYMPIVLNGKLIQVCICHDMFYPLLMERLHIEGMDILINLTGGNVKISKWNALLKGRSLEISSTVLCTMGNRTSMGQKSDRIAFRDGHQLKPLYSTYDGTQRNAYSIFDLERYEKEQQPTPFYSDKQYEQFTVGFENEDITFDEEGEIQTTLKEVEVLENSYRFEKNGEIIHFHFGGLYELYSRTYIYSEPRRENDHEVFFYSFEDKIPYDEAVAFAKLRAIENRVAVIICTDDYMIGAKTNRYKDVQLFHGESIGFDLQHMKGFDSVYEKNERSMNGINIVHKEKYEALINVGSRGEYANE